MSELQKNVARIAALADEVLAKDGRFPKLEQRVVALAGLLGINEEGEDGVDIKAVVEDVERLKAAQDALAARVRTARTPYYVPGLEDEAHKFSVTRAILAHKSRNWEKAPFEREALQAVREKAGSHLISDDEQGGLFVPDQVIPDWIPAIYTRSQWIGLDGEGETRVSVIGGLTGVPAKIPEFKGGLTAYWVGEAGKVEKSTTKTGARLMTPKKLAAAFSMTLEMMENATAFDPFIRREITRRIAMELDRAVAYGTGGDHQILGLALQDGILIYRAETGDVYTSLAAARGIGDWDGGELSPDKFEFMKVAIEELDHDSDDSFGTGFSPRYKHRLKTTKVDNYSGQTERQGYLMQPFLSDPQLRDLIGPFFTSNHIKSNRAPGASIGATNSSGEEKFTDVFRGNFGEIVLGLWGGIRFDDDGGEGSDFLTEETNFKARIRLDMTVRHKTAIALCPDARARD